MLGSDPSATWHLGELMPGIDMLGTNPTTTWRLGDSMQGLTQAPPGA